MIKFSWRIFVTIISSLTALFLLLGAYGGYIDPRSWSFPSLVVLGFPIVAVVALVLLALCLLLRNNRAATTIGVALLVSFPAIKQNMPLSWSSTPDDKSKAFTVLTWNVIGFETMTQGAQQTTMQHILDVDADVVVLQESSLDGNDFMEYPNVKKYASEVIAKYPYRSNSRGDVAIMSKVPFELVPDNTMRNRLDSTVPHTYGRIFDMKIKEHYLRIIGLHMQSIGLSSEDKQLFKDVVRGKEYVDSKAQAQKVKHSLIDKLISAFKRRAGEAQAVHAIIEKSPRNLIVCGDFNDVPGSYSYRTVRGDMSDAYVDCGTWPVNTYNRNGFYFRIDHMFYRGQMDAVSSRIEKVGESDHYPIVTTFEWKERD